jgi:hypothetical protein
MRGINLLYGKAFNRGDRRGKAAEDAEGSGRLFVASAVYGSTGLSIRRFALRPRKLKLTNGGAYEKRG